MDFTNSAQGVPPSTRVYRLGWLYDGEQLHERCLLAVRDGRILYRGQLDTPWPAGLDAALHQAEIVEVPRGLALPGLVNAHHHAYSALARGMPVPSDLRDFRDVLERLWWPLDRSLSLEAVELSALVTAMDCLHCGVTTVFDHHASPLALEGSLELVARSFSGLGLEALVCFEISDRFGDQGVSRALEENLAFARAHAATPKVRGMLGLHAGFTLSDATLTRVAAEAPADLPVHVHVAEDLCDVEHARACGHAGPLARLAAFQLLRPRSLVVHGVHLADEELPLLDSHDAFVVHNWESNANNRVGVADLARVPWHRAMLGTDGMGSNMLLSLRAAFLGARAFGSEPRGALSRVLSAGLCNPWTYAAQTFGRPVTRLEAGQEADFAVFETSAPTPLSTESLGAELVFGLPGGGQARYVHAHGALVVDDGTLLGVDETGLRAQAARAAKDVWRHYSALPIFLFP